MRSSDADGIGLFDEVLSTPREAVSDDIREQTLYERAEALQRLGRTQESADTLETLARDYPSGRLAPRPFSRLPKSHSMQDATRRRRQASRGSRVISPKAPLPCRPCTAEPSRCKDLETTRPRSMDSGRASPPGGSPAFLHRHSMALAHLSEPPGSLEARRAGTRARRPRPPVSHRGVRRRAARCRGSHDRRTAR